MLKPGDNPLLADAAAHHAPPRGFWHAPFRRALGWSLKEMWVNVFEAGGFQVMHNHANCFISGIAYLRPSHPEARTVFMKSAGGHDYAFKNDHPRSGSGRTTRSVG
jgi:hypothetical protein